MKKNFLKENSSGWLQTQILLLEHALCLVVDFIKVWGWAVWFYILDT